MKSLWRRRSAQVKDVQPDLLPDRELAYTTVMTVMDRLFKKGILRRTKKSRAHLYEPVYSEAEVRADAVTGLVDDFFDGSEAQLRDYLNGEEAPREVVPSRPSVDSSVAMDESLL